MTSPILLQIRISLPFWTEDYSSMLGCRHSLSQSRACHLQVPRISHCLHDHAKWPGICAPLQHDWHCCFAWSCSCCSLIESHCHWSSQRQCSLLFLAWNPFTAIWLWRASSIRGIKTVSRGIRYYYFCKWNLLLPGSKAPCRVNNNWESQDFLLQRCSPENNKATFLIKLPSKQCQTCLTNLNCNKKTEQEQE